MRIGSLFTGYGGLDLAVEEHFAAETVWCSDIDPGACKIIAHRMPGIPNLGDITAIDWAAVEPVDILTGGWPCQPFSLAGKRKGAADERALWPFVAGAVRALRPRLVVLENVAAIATAGELGRACADLAALGYVGSWRCLRAADVGAPHGRARIFIVATDTARHTGLRGVAPVGGRPVPGRDGQSATADSLGGGRNGRARQLGQRRRLELANGRHSLADAGCDARTGDDANGPTSGRGGVTPADTDNDGLQGERRLEPIRRDPDGRSGAHVAWGAYEPAIRRWERILGRTAPAPTQTSPKGSQRLSPSLVEWMMGLPDGWVCDVPGLTRNEQLKALGNGVVPQQAIEALRRMQAAEVAA